jgi:hypothetical protein
VNASACAVAASALPRAAANRASVPAVITRPVNRSRRSRAAVSSGSAASRGGSLIKPVRGASKPSAMAGGPSMIIAIHRILMGVNGSGSPSRGAAVSAVRAATVVVSWKRTNLTMFS